MKTKFFYSQRNYPLPRTAIEAVWCSGADRRSFEASAMPFEKRHARCEERETDPDGKAAKEFVIAVIQTDLSIPDPSDLNLLKWGGYVAAIGLTATVEYFAIKAIQSSISKAKEANRQRNCELGSITIQIQQGTRSIKVGSTRFALNEKGVTKRQAQKALDEQVTMLSNNRGYGHLAKSKKFQTAVSEMSENIKTKHTVGDGD